METMYFVGSIFILLIALMITIDFFFHGKEISDIAIEQDDDRQERQGFEQSLLGQMRRDHSRRINRGTLPKQIWVKGK